MDKATMKSREHTNWTRVVPGWAQHHDRLRKNTQAVTDRLLELAVVHVGHKLLDVASGTGEPAISAALRVGPAGHVLGTDFVEEMLEFARQRADERGLTNAEFRRIDGERLEVARDSFDAVTIRWGLMFMPDPGSCLARAHEALKPGGRIAVACWAGPERNPWAAIPMGAVKRHIEVPPPPPGATGLFAFADPERLRATIEGAGFRDVTIEPVEFVLAAFDTGAELFDFVCALAGPISALFRQLDRPAQEACAREAATLAEGQSIVPGRAVLKGVTWVAAATK